MSRVRDEVVRERMRALTCDEMCFESTQSMSRVRDEVVKERIRALTCCEMVTSVTISSQKNFLVTEGLLGARRICTLSHTPPDWGPHNARVAVWALLEQLAVTLLIRTLRHQTARWLHVKPPPGTQADEGAALTPPATAAATGDGRGEEGQGEGRAGGGARERVGGVRAGGRVRAAVSHVVVASVVAYVDGRLCRHIPNAFLRRVVSGFLLSFVDL
ncbi:unnamed protein product [Closterium sp. NIES-64]|nr:unnamed protein product [Closterium sp. NIES-64]